MMKNFIPVNTPFLNGNEKKYLKECIDTGWISSEGPFVKKFEKEFAKKVGRKHGIAVTNGTAAIDVAIESLGIKKGDEVIISTFTIISCVLQIIRAGAKPVLVDVDPLTWNMDIHQVKSKINFKTKAIMAVHIYGLPVDLDPLLDLCKKYKLKLIEDAAELIGQTYKGKPCGSFGEISTVSFYTNKHITTGEGGMVLTDDDRLAKKCRELRNLCFIQKKRFIHYNLVWNLRMSNLQAAVGIAQLEKLDYFIKKKKWIGDQYNKLLANVEAFELPLKSTHYADNIYWVYGILLNRSSKLNAKTAIQRLNKLGIGCRPFFFPMHKQPVLKKLSFYKGEKYPNSERISKFGFYIPSGLGLNLLKIKKVSKAIKKIF